MLGFRLRILKVVSVIVLGLCLVNVIISVTNTKDDFNYVETTTSPYEKEVEKDLQKQWYGFGDNGVRVELFGPEKEQGERDLSKLAINEALSKRIPYNRSLPDSRYDQCKLIKYDVDSLPTASVIMTFYHELYSVLVRSLHSVVNTASKNLKEIILVDDGNKDNEELKGKLDYYVQTRFPSLVKIIRLNESVGIIKSRLFASEIATGDILIFMDAHTECVPHWLEPMAQRIKESPTRLVVPIVEHTNSDTFQYFSYNPIQGGFSWGGYFLWIAISREETQRQKDVCGSENIKTCPMKTPAIIGGYFAINREFFMKIGSYDKEMVGWGGENIEISLRVWMCGGSVETLPCSKIAHMAKKFRTYSYGINTYDLNTVRLVETWMDEYKANFYLFRPDLKALATKIDVSERVELRKSLNCKSFDWYLKNVYPEKFIPLLNNTIYGRVQNKASGLCLENGYKIPNYLILAKCSDKTRNDQFLFLQAGSFQFETHCVLFDGKSNKKNFVNIRDCIPERKQWKYTACNQLRHTISNMCLDTHQVPEKGFVFLSACSCTKKSQKWKFQNFLY